MFKWQVLLLAVVLVSCVGCAGGNCDLSGHSTSFCEGTPISMGVRCGEYEYSLTVCTNSFSYECDQGNIPAPLVTVEHGGWVAIEGVSAQVEGCIGVVTGPEL